MTAADLEHLTGAALLIMSAPFVVLAAVVGIYAYLKRGQL